MVIPFRALQRRRRPSIVAAIFVVSTILVAGPVAGEESDDGVTDDADRDAYTVTRHIDGGTGFGGGSCEVEDNSSEQKYSTSWCSSFAVFAAVVPIPPQFEDATAYSLGPRLMKACATQGVRDEPDPSFQWWLDALAQSSKSEDLDGTVAARWEIPLTWNEGSPRIPESHGIRLTGDDATQFIANYSIWCGGVPTIDSASGVWVSYGARSHRDPFGDEHFRTVATAEDDELVATRHGVILKRDDRHAWIFVSDGHWGGPSKLRIPSIQGAGFVDGEWVWIAQSGGGTASTWMGPGSIWLVEVDTGRIVRIVMARLEWTDSHGVPRPETSPVPMKVEEFQLTWRDDSLHVIAEDDEGEEYSAPVRREDLWP